MTAAPPDPFVWQMALVGLLARLEYLRLELDGRRLGADPGFVLDVAVALVEATEELARQTAFPAESAATLADAVARAGAFFSAVGGARKDGARGLFRSVFGGAPAAPAVRSCLLSAVDALHRYFALFTERFPSSVAARGWVDAASTFLIDLKATARDLPE